MDVVIVESVGFLPVTRVTSLFAAAGGAHTPSTADLGQYFRARIVT